MRLIGNLFGNLFGDSASEFEARGDQFAGVNNWRRAFEEYEHAIQKTARSSPAYRRLAAKIDEARRQSFDSLIEDIHSRIDVREFTYANEQLELARGWAETSTQLARVEEVESRLRGAGRYEPRRRVPASRSSALFEEAEESSPQGAARLDRAAASPAVPRPSARLDSGAVSAGVNPDQTFQRLLAHMPAAAIQERRNLGVRYRDAALALAEGDNQRAVELLSALRKEKPDIPWLLYDLAASLRLVGRTREAQALYLERMQEDPQDWQACYELALCLWEEDNKDRALQVIESGLKKHPRSGHLMAQWGIFLYKLGSTRRALEKLYLALQLDSFDDPGLYHTIANLHLELGEEDKARRGYLKALELQPNSIGTLLDYAEFLIDKRQDARAALAILENAFRAIRLGSGRRLYHVYASYLSSRAHMMVGEREMALLAVTRALEDNDQAWLSERLESQRQAVLNV